MRTYLKTAITLTQKVENKPSEEKGKKKRHKDGTLIVYGK